MTPTPHIPASPILGVILAGGLGRRIGGDKALIPLNGQPLIAHVRDRLAPQVAALVVNANGDAARLGFLGLPVIADSVPDHPGPLAGVLAGLEHAAAHGYGAIITVPTDCPFLPVDLAARLAAAIPPDSPSDGPSDGLSDGPPAIICAASGGRRHPVAALWPVAVAADLRTALVDEGVRRMERAMDRHPVVTVAFADTSPDPFFNINTADDLLTAARWGANHTANRKL